jgi:hypothetical protein
MDLDNAAFFEEVTERFCGQVVASTIRSATAQDIAEARLLHDQGKCPHNIVIDEKGWLYDARSCFICGKGLGAV